VSFQNEQNRPTGPNCEAEEEEEEEEGENNIQKFCTLNV
jgi:hypothetical protein